MLPYPVLEYGDYGKRKTICCLHLRRKGLHGNGFRAYGKGQPLFLPENPILTSGNEMLKMKIEQMFDLKERI